MMRHRNPGKRIAVVLLCALAFSVMSSVVLAAVPHEDPEAAVPVFSGVALFRYYSESLDFILGKNPLEAEARLSKMPFASVPQNLAAATDNFAVSATSLSFHIAGIDEGLGKLRTLMSQYRRDEALELMTVVSDNLSRADGELGLIAPVAETIGEEMGVSSVPANSDLRRSYDEMVQRIDRIREMLTLYRDLMTEYRLIAEGLQPAEITLEAEGLQPAEITLEIEPMVAFVGDDVRFGGRLTSGGEPLAGRQVDILLNTSSEVSVLTDADGRYQGVLSVPYWYIPEIDWQALYYPRRDDIGLYLASLSPAVELEVLFYQASVAPVLADRAYPGRATVVSGLFYYGQSPPLEQRKAEIYLDKVFITEFVVQEVFAHEIRIDAEIELGEHVVTISAKGDGRYAPVVGSSILNVTRATPIIELDVPRFVLMPGGAEIGGRLSSEVGPLSGALLRVGLAESRAELTTTEDGTFNGKIKMGLGLGMIGWQDLELQVIAQEPWHDSLRTTRGLLVVNWVNTGGLLALLLLLGVYLPRRLSGKLGGRVRGKVKPAVVPVAPEPAPAHSETVPLLALVDDSDRESHEPRRRILYWYRLVLRLIEKMARASLRPQQTLREFAYQHSRALGPGAKYFVELTRMVEKVVYSQYPPTEADVESSQQLSLRVEEESKPELAPIADSSYEKGKQGGRKG